MEVRQTAHPVLKEICEDTANFVADYISVYTNLLFWHVYVLGCAFLRDLGNLAYRTVISWRHSGDIDRYWYARVTYAHVWARVAGWVGE
jgi:hypothetical protein